MTDDHAPCTDPDCRIHRLPEVNPCLVRVVFTEAEAAGNPDASSHVHRCLYRLDHESVHRCRTCDREYETPSEAMTRRRAVRDRRTADALLRVVERMTPGERGVILTVAIDDSVDPWLVYDRLTDAVARLDAELRAERVTMIDDATVTVDRDQRPTSDRPEPT